MEKQNSKRELGVTAQSEDYSKWYNDVVHKADLAEHSPVRGSMVIKPYGYAIWENVQKILDQKFKETGHENAYFPLFIPMSYLQKEAEHVEGFSPELAVVTHAGGKELEEPLVVRPTSETIINAMYSKWIKSYRDLPVLINQWANVVRWEMRPRLFLRTTEFLWQEGHTVHATHEEAIEETMKMLNVYRDFADNYAALAPVVGEKSDLERFAGALNTYSIEAMMKDKKALQSATSHYFGQHFAKAFNIQFQNKNNQLEYGWQTSWGISTRIIGAIIMSHGDDKGLVLPPKVAPYQVVIVPIGTKKIDDKAKVMEAVNKIKQELIALGVRVKLDDRDNVTPGFKFNEWEMKGVPLRLDMGPKDIDNNQAVLARRDISEKNIVSRDGLAENIVKLLDEIQSNMFKIAKDFRESNTKEVKTLEELKEYFSDEKNAGFALCSWDGCNEVEQQLKDEFRVSHRCYPMNLEPQEGICIATGKTTMKKAIFAKSY